MIISTFDLEKELIGKGHDFIIGIDEAGRGPLAGPVVAAAVVLKNPVCHPEFISGSLGKENRILKQVQNDRKKADSKEDLWNLVRDSKTLSQKQREKAYGFVMENFHVGVGICDHSTIDRMNILQASFLAMKKAISDINDSTVRRRYDVGTNAIILLDGNKEIPNLSRNQKAVPKGDKKIKSISAASIIAKVTRDRMMLEMHEKHPNYSFDKHKGYGTKAHMEALEKFGPCEFHRMSFGPVKKVLGS